MGVFLELGDRGHLCAVMEGRDTNKGKDRPACVGSLLAYVGWE